MRWCRRSGARLGRDAVTAPEMRVLPGAGHFFHGRLNELRDVVLGSWPAPHEAAVASPPRFGAAPRDVRLRGRFLARNTSENDVLVGVAAMVALASACETVQQTRPVRNTTRRARRRYRGCSRAVIGLLTRGDKFQNALIGAAIAGSPAARSATTRPPGTAVAREHGGIGRPGRPSGQQHHIGHAGQHHLRQQQCRRERGFLPDPRQGQHDPGPVRPDHGRGGRPHGFDGQRRLQSGLSERRAKSVAAYLTSRACGQNVSWSWATGEHPIASNDTTAGRQQNRRVELTIVPVEKKSEGSRRAGRDGRGERLTTKSPAGAALLPAFARGCGTPGCYWLTIPFRLFRGMTRTFLLAALA